MICLGNIFKYQKNWRSFSNMRKIIFDERENMNLFNNSVYNIMLINLKKLKEVEDFLWEYEL